MSPDLCPMQPPLAHSCRYHNRIHAADVLQSLHVLLCRGNLLANGIVDDTALLACHLSAIIHDFEHRYGAKGVTARGGLEAWRAPCWGSFLCKVRDIAAEPAIGWTWEGACRGVCTFGEGPNSTAFPGVTNGGEAGRTGDWLSCCCFSCFSS